MSSLGARALRMSALAVAVVLAVGSAAGLVRLLPWLLAPEVPLEVALPFARALGAQATETAFLFGLPIGFAFAAARFVERGEARALFALGASPLRIAGSIAPHALLCASISLALGLAWGSAADVPGRFARQLVEQGHASCTKARAPRSASVPLVGVTWLCFPGRPARVAGPLPGAGSSAWFTATDITPSDDLSSVELANLRIVSKMGDGGQRLDVSVRHGTIRGLPAWGRSAKLTPLARGALTATTALALSVVGLLALVALGVERRWLALAFGGAPALTAFVVLHRLDPSSLASPAYALVPASALALLVLLSAGVRRVAGPRAQ
jgi:hypothetical protein